MPEGGSEAGGGLNIVPSSDPFPIAILAWVMRQGAWLRLTLTAILAVIRGPGSLQSKIFDSVSNSGQEKVFVAFEDYLFAGFSFE